MPLETVRTVRRFSISLSEHVARCSMVLDWLVGLCRCGDRAAGSLSQGKDMKIPQKCSGRLERPLGAIKTDIALLWTQTGNNII